MPGGNSRGPDRRSERIAELVSEAGQLRALVAEVISKASILTAYDDTGELSALIDHLSERAGLAAEISEAAT
jgi:NADP-dependent 3-hydroxy acid dehydrogenase YdfG